ncbi:hypothetical protein SAMN05216588_101192 [Pseudomonas flavescens]|uniref:Uncharacterized protein n=1 Tax=Phytopseudomonas flavescens TaxID=29435 RepID=A0A1G7XMD3_9GAMM|nr:hypothetical protein [Pseudomonas flavescens]SDG85347.1 hypothetical protein SAMN05216588_101192 [Pseudomonas flavescens]
MIIDFVYEPSGDDEICKWARYNTDLDLVIDSGNYRKAIPAVGWGPIVYQGSRSVLRREGWSPEVGAVVVGRYSRCPVSANYGEAPTPAAVLGTVRTGINPTVDELVWASGLLVGISGEQNALRIDTSGGEPAEAVTSCSFWGFNPIFQTTLRFADGHERALFFDSDVYEVVRLYVTTPLSEGAMPAKQLSLEPYQEDVTGGAVAYALGMYYALEIARQCMEFGELVKCGDIVAFSGLFEGHFESWLDSQSGVRKSTVAIKDGRAVMEALLQEFDGPTITYSVQRIEVSSSAAGQYSALFSAPRALFNYPVTLDGDSNWSTELFREGTVQVTPATAFWTGLKLAVEIP